MNLYENHAFCEVSAKLHPKTMRFIWGPGLTR